MSEPSISAETKTCSACGEKKPLGEFHLARKNRDGREGQCKTCKREAFLRRKKISPDEFRKKAREATRRYREANPGKGAECARRWREDNRGEHLERKRRYYAENKEKIREAAKRYAKANQDRITAYRRDKYTADPVFRTAVIFRVRFSDWFKSRGKGKKGAVLASVGCGPDDLVAHIENQFQPGMTWDNYGKHGWHIDHIVPLASAGNDVDAMMNLWHYTNLQPLWAEENWSKGAKVP